MRWIAVVLLAAACASPPSPPVATAPWAAPTIEDELTPRQDQDLAIRAVRITMTGKGYDIGDYTDAEIEAIGRALCDMLDAYLGDREDVIDRLSWAVVGGELTEREGMLAASTLGVAAAWCPRWEH